MASSWEGSRWILQPLGVRRGDGVLIHLPWLPRAFSSDRVCCPTSQTAHRGKGESACTRQPGDGRPAQASRGLTQHAGVSTCDLHRAPPEQRPPDLPGNQLEAGSLLLFLKSPGTREGPAVCLEIFFMGRRGGGRGSSSCFYSWAPGQGTTSALQILYVVIKSELLHFILPQLAHLYNGAATTYLTEAPGSECRAGSGCAITSHCTAGAAALLGAPSLALLLRT